MNKPNFLKTRREKRIERKTDTIIALIGLAVSAKNYHQRNEKRELENENLRLKNRLLDLEAQDLETKIIVVEN
jgi:hypothetical protein